jgi:hypothetical protein
MKHSLNSKALETLLTKADIYLRLQVYYQSNTDASGYSFMGKSISLKQKHLSTLSLIFDWIFYREPIMPMHPPTTLRVKLAKHLRLELENKTRPQQGTEGELPPKT